MKENKLIQNNLNKLRNLMEKAGIDIYIVPTDDFHGSEYVGEYFKSRAFISGFTGSAGTVVVTKDEAGLWTDGRYFLQAADQLEGTTITLNKMYEPGVPTIIEYIKDKAIDNTTIGFDGRTISSMFVLNMLNTLKNKKVNIVYNVDLIDEVWENRPSISKEKAFLLDEKYAGESRVSKIQRVRAVMNKDNTSFLVLTSLDDIAWLLNIRGNDVACNPVVLSYVLLSNDYLNLYVNDGVLDDAIKDTFAKEGITIKAYNDIYQDVCKLEKGSRVSIEQNKVNYALYASLENTNRINKMNPTTCFKAIKNEVEIKNTYNAHLKDGVALTKFIYDLKMNVGKEKMTELSCVRKLESFRRMQENYMGPSFETIAGFDYHGAIIHYDPTEETDIEVLPKSFLLVDSGGQYLEGTTDVTRTIALGDLSPKQKEHYTLVLKGHLALSNAKFVNGTCGNSLDMLARKPLWDNGLNYNHGTGHGVGYFLNVHEGPQNISNAAGRASYPFKPGMITSNEPGLYLPNEYGIRIENLVLCKEDKKTVFGDFLCFDDLTLAPYELDAIDTKLLSKEEKKQIHSYHKRVYKALSPYLNKEEKDWLKQVVEAVK